MKIKSNLFRELIRLKNRQILREREKTREKEESIRILSAYLAMLVEKHGTVRIPKEVISSALGRYRAEAVSVGDDYAITVTAHCEKKDKNGKDKI